MDATPPTELEYLQPGPASGTDRLPPAAARWLAHKLGAPTPIQQLAWPAVAAGKSVLISAPTGSGKTLAALLPLVGRLAAGAGQADGSVWSVGSSLRGLYLAPLKALTNDIARTLSVLGNEMALLLPPGCSPPRVGVRHGDIPAAERRAQLSDPPDLLLTTPESLAVLLSQPEAGELFAPLRWVILDEVHALAASKRGADLSISLERLERLAAEPLQRIGLSATATPLEEAARYLVGVGRACAIAAVDSPVPLELEIVQVDPSRRFLAELVRHLEPVLRQERSTLVFTNTRSLAERLAWLLRRQCPEWDDQVGVHHSALAPARREEVEQRLKAGLLRAVVTSTSLELGVDIGPVDRVVLVHPPGDVIRLLQRLGRSGHGPRRARRGLVLTAGAAQLLEATVTAASGLAGQCEPLHIPDHPLDMLCQQVVGMACAGEWSLDEIHALVRRAWPFRALERGDLESCVHYLLGLDRDGQPWLPARLAGGLDALKVRDQRTAKLMRRSLGAILAEDAVPVCLIQVAGTAAVAAADPDAFPAEALLTIGDLDPGFVERLAPGDRFLLDGRCLEVRRREEGQVVVEEVIGRPLTPRWSGDGLPLSTELARRLYLLRVRAAEALRDGPAALAALLQGEYGLAAPECGVLAGYFERQEAVSEIPEPGLCLVEVLAAAEREAHFLHTPLTRAGNDALARVVVHRLARDHGQSAQSIVADLGWTLLPLGGSLLARVGEAGLADFWRALMDAHHFEEDLAEALEESLAFRERFQGVATTGLMLPRGTQGQGRPRSPRVGGRRWGERRLFDLVRLRDPAFVLLRQARREIRAGWCDAAAGRQFVAELPGWAIRCRWVSRPSPFAEAWTQEAFGTIEIVETPAETLRRLQARLLASAAPEAG